MARFEQDAKEKSYRVYVTDCLQALSKNTAKYASGAYITDRWIDRIEPKKQDTRTGAEIAADVIKKAGLKVVRNSESV